MTFFAVYAADAVDAFRALAARIRRSRSGALWFALLFAGSVWLGLRLAEAAAIVGLPPGFEVTPGTLLFLAFFVSLAKGAVDAYHRAIRPDALVFLFAQPLSRRAVAVGKFLTVLWFNLAFLAGALALAVVFVALGGMRVDLPADFAAALVLAVVAGLASGFTLAVLGSLATWRRKAAGLAAFAPVVGVLYGILVAANVGVRDALLALALAVPVSLLAVVGTSPFLLEAWNNQTSGRRWPGEARPYLRLPDPMLEVLVDKELKTMVRKRQVALSAATIAVVGLALLAFYATVGPVPGLPPPLGALFYPMVIAAAVYVVAATQLTVPGMAALGRELDRLWILKSLPVPGRAVYGAKTLATLLIVPAVLVGVVLPLPLVAGFDLPVIAVLLVASLAVSFALTALGLYVGARDPNFDPNTDGLPDSIGLYNVFLAALFVAFLVAAVPANVFRLDRVLGLLTAVFVAALAALAVVLATRGAARRYEAMEV